MFDLATKTDLRAALSEFVTRAELKSELAALVTKAEFTSAVALLKAEIERDFHKSLTAHTLAIVTIVTAVIAASHFWR